MGTIEHFNERGYAGPVKVFSPEQSHEICTCLEAFPEPPGWFKSSAAHYPLFRELACHPVITGILAELLGNNIMLWGASLVTAPRDTPTHGTVILKRPMQTVKPLACGSP